MCVKTLLRYKVLLRLGPQHRRLPRADFMAIGVARRNSPNNILADKEKLFFSVFLLCSVL